MTSFACILSAWHAHEPELRGYLIRRLGDGHTADDLLQDVFLKSIRQGAAFCSLENPRAWLFHVAKNALVDHMRTVKPAEPLPVELAAPDETRAPVDQLDVCLVVNLPLLAAEDRDVIEQCDLAGVKQQEYAAAAA